MNDITNEVQSYLTTLQNNICASLGKFEPQNEFFSESWQRDEGGGGETRVISDGEVWERAGVNFSHVRGKSLPASASANRPELANQPFEAMGVSVVIHPNNPYIPTSHMNVRFFIGNAGSENPTWWFGGGWDLTPYYAFKQDAIHWHQVAYDTCLPFGENVYQRYKKWCDEYFYLPHRQETRGIGGLFFDDLNAWDKETCFKFMQQVGSGYLTAYLPIVTRRLDTPYSKREREFQLYRRGRYVEFNLIYDRGTLFGLQSGGRTESILMSMPPRSRWEYNWKPTDGSAEAELYRSYLKPRDWLKTND